jgi:hypothetical protein
MSETIHYGRVYWYIFPLLKPYHIQDSCLYTTESPAGHIAYLTSLYQYALSYTDSTSIRNLHQFRPMTV